MGTVASIAGVIVLIPTLLFLSLGGMTTRFPVTSNGTPGLGANENKAWESAELPWVLGHPQIDFAIAVPAKQVATFSLVRSDSFEILETLNLQGFVVAADDRPFEGRVRFGSTLGSSRPEGSPMWLVQLFGKEGGRATSTGDLPGEWLFDTESTPVELYLTEVALNLAW
jgi:hypothetical protein